MTKKIAEKIVRGIKDKIEANTVDMDDWAKFWGFTVDEYEDFLDMAIKALSQEPCEDCLANEPCEDWHDVPSYKMTFGQARQAVKDLRRFVVDNYILPIQPCEDCISRKAVLNLTKELRFNSVKGMEDYCYRCIDPNDVEELPPIQLKTKVGKWIRQQSYSGYTHTYECSECGRTIYAEDDLTDHPYCHCGAKMEVE